jgi:precorrin-8X/cobalt-precorrin-8 methylmutase
MSKGSSHREATTENTYIDLGADTEEGFSISTRSRALARTAVGSANDEDRVRQRCSIAVGDFEMAKLIRFERQPIEAGLEALANKAPILVDIRMVQVGIQKKGHDSPVKCFLDFGQEISKERGITRTSAGIFALKDEVDGAIIVIGNAPSSLLVLCDMINQGQRPALVIGSAVGFVNAADSKVLLRTMPVPSISVEGTRGGTPVAVAALNEIITIFNERKHDK